MKSRWMIAAASAALLLTGAYAQEASRNDATKQETAPKAAPASTPGVPSNWRQVPIPPLPAFHPRQPRRVVLPNGMILFMTENHELPLIQGTVIIRGGSDSEPAGKTSLTELYAETWRTGGTEKMTGDQLDDLLESRAAKVETAAGDSETTISFNCLKADFPEVLGVINDLLRSPAFREDKLALAKKQMNSSIARRNDETEDIAQMQTEILGYGKQSAYARIPEYATVAAVTREDLVEWHRSHATPNNIIFGITGDFDAAAIELQLSKTFGDWSKGAKTAEPKLSIDPAKPGIYLVDKSDVNQSEIRMISLGIERRNPDYFALQVMNEIFGGGFSSRLFSNLRTKAGLAYSVGGGVGSNWDHPGLTVFELGTKTETTVEAIKGLWDQVDKLKSEPPTELELKRAKDAILNSFIFNFDTPAKVLREQQTYEFFGYPADFLEQYRAGVEKVTAADVTRVANKYVHKDELKVLVVGNAGEFEKQLASLGPVTPIDITIPPPPEAGAGKPAGTNAEGRAAIDRLAEALGGKARVDAIKSMRQVVTMQQQGQEVKIDQSIVYPDKQAQKISLPQGELLQVVTPTAAFMSMASQTRELPPSERSSEINALKRDFINVIQHAGDPNFAFAASGKEKLGEIETTIVDVNADGARTRWWIATDGRLLQEQFSEGPQTLTMQYSDWKDYGGLRYPAKFVMSGDPQSEFSMTLDQLEINPAIDPKLFEKP